jgi:hypothetical protein
MYWTDIPVAPPLQRRQNFKPPHLKEYLLPQHNQVIIRMEI